MVNEEAKADKHRLSLDFTPAAGMAAVPRHHSTSEMVKKRKISNSPRSSALHNKGKDQYEGQELTVGVAMLHLISLISEEKTDLINRSEVCVNKVSRHLSLLNLTINMACVVYRRTQV